MIFRASHSATSRGALCALLGAVVVSCGKKAVETTNQAAQAPVPASVGAVQSDRKIDTELLAALAPVEGDAGGQTAEDLESEAERVMSLYPGKNAQDMLNVPEVNPKLVEALKGLAADPQLQAAINKSVDLAAYFKGLSGPPGAFRLNLDVKAYDGPRTQRMLAAVLSGKPKPVVQFLVDELGEAAFEFSFTEANKTSNGITLEANPNPPAAAVAAPD